MNANHKKAIKYVEDEVAFFTPEYIIIKEAMQKFKLKKADVIEIIADLKTDLKTGGKMIFTEAHMSGLACSYYNNIKIQINIIWETFLKNTETRDKKDIAQGWFLIEKQLKDMRWFLETFPIAPSLEDPKD